MKNTAFAIAVTAVAGCLMTTVPAFASSENQQGQGQAVITVLPAKNAAPATVSQQDLALKVNGKATDITGFEPLQGPNSRVELVIMIDDGARASLGNQMSDIANFIKTLPPNTAVTLGYMQNGQTQLTGPFTTNHEQVANTLRITNGIRGINGSPYFCLSSLAKNWPSHDTDARREVVMVTDGVDYYEPYYNPDDPYVLAAINDATRAHVIVYSIYWTNTGRFDRTMLANYAGQNLLQEVTDATGGNSYWLGMGNPVTLVPYFDDIKQRLNHQYELSFMAPFNGRYDLANFRLKVNNGTRIAAPQQVVVAPGSTGGGEQ
ncbi:MAG TPA: hypothetical protein VL986_05985 [Terracidiphilus sp.]|nr:hypothetical protein [Terracidiphilus sp.]